MQPKNYPRLYIQGLVLVRPEVLNRRQILEIVRDHADRFTSIRELTSVRIALRKNVRDDYGTAVGGWQLGNRIELCVIGCSGRRLRTLTLVTLLAHELYHLSQDPCGQRQASSVPGPQGRYQVGEERRAIRWSVAYTRSWSQRELTRLAHKELWPLKRYPLR